MDKELAANIRSKLDELIAATAPDAVAREMYGGTMYEVVPGDHSSRVFGHFAYENHVSLEFTEGASFDDPNNLLEGSGKLRRHLKLYSVADVQVKNALFYIKQAMGCVTTDKS